MIILFMSKKILILKNDRTGDLFVSLKAINRVLIKQKNDKITIFLSQINHKFSFLLPNIKKEIISMHLGLREKINRFKKDKQLRKTIAKNRKASYFRNFNSTKVAKYIIDKTFEVDLKDRYVWEN